MKLVSGLNLLFKTGLIDADEVRLLKDRLFSTFEKKGVPPEQLLRRNYPSDEKPGTSGEPTRALRLYSDPDSSATSLK